MWPLFPKEGVHRRLESYQSGLVHTGWWTWGRATRNAGSVGCGDFLAPPPLFFPTQLWDRQWLALRGPWRCMDSRDYYGLSLRVASAQDRTHLAVMDVLLTLELPAVSQSHPEAHSLFCLNGSLC